jgi:hypothetical protein
MNGESPEQRRHACGASTRHAAVAMDIPTFRPMGHRLVCHPLQ